MIATRQILMMSAALVILGFSALTQAQDQAADNKQKITGIIRQPNGQGAVGMVVKVVGIWGSGASEVETDAEGKFELDLPHRDSDGATPCILVRDVAHELSVAQNLEEDTTSLDLKLAPSLTLVGRVESEGKPVPNVTAALVFWTGRHGMHLSDLTINTNVPGHFEIPTLPPGRKYGIVVSASGYGQKSVYDISASAEPGRMELDPVELKIAKFKIAGKVVDSEEKPVSTAHVYMYGENQPSGNTTTDSDGRFTYDKVCEGTIRLSASSQGMNGNVSAEAGETNVVIQMGQSSNNSSSSASHKLKGTVLDADGKPAQGVRLAVFPSNNGPHWTKSATNGTFDLNWSLEPWQQQSGARLIARDLSRNLASCEELSEETTNIVTKLKRALEIVGLAQKTNGTPLAGAEVDIQLKCGNNYVRLDEKTTVTDAQGRFALKGFPSEGTYWVNVNAKGYGQGQQTIESDSETNRMELPPFVLNVADQILEGQVVNENEKPLSAVNVSIYGEGQPSENVTTDTKGRFHFKVCEGQVRVSVNSQNGFAQASAQAGETNLVITLSSRPGSGDQPVLKTSLNGKPLPDLATVNLAVEAVPASGSVLLCLFDAGQRPSRHVVHQLSEKVAELKLQGITVLGVQATVTTDEIFNAWKTASPVVFPVGRVTNKSDKTKWASSTASFPKLILTDSKHLVIAEGFAFDELDAQVKKLTK